MASAKVATVSIRDFVRGPRMAMSEKLYHTCLDNDTVARRHRAGAVKTHGVHVGCEGMLAGWFRPVSEDWCYAVWSVEVVTPKACTTM
jgi:hypothetical protein